MIKRAEQQHACARRIRDVELTGVAEPRDTAAAILLEPSTRLFDVRRNRIDQLHVITLTQQPLRVGAGSAADIENPTRRWREIARDDVFRAHALERARACRQPLRFAAAAIMLEDLA